MELLFMSSVTFTLDGTDTTYNICGTVISTSCADFFGNSTYLVVEFDNGTGGINLRGQLQGIYTSNMTVYAGTSFLPISKFNLQSNVRFKNLDSVTGSVTFSTSDSIGASCPTISGNLPITENGTFDVSNYASVSVNVPQENVTTELTPYSNLVVDSFWQYHKAFASAVAAIIVIFLVYRILKGRLK